MGNDSQRFLAAGWKRLAKKERELRIKEKQGAELEFENWKREYSKVLAMTEKLNTIKESVNRALELSHD